MELQKRTETFFQRQDVKRVQYFLLAVLFWLWVSLGLALEIKSSSVFLVLKPVLYTKVLLMALLFGGRYLFFPLARWRTFFRWSLIAIFTVICGVTLFHDVKWLSYPYLACLRFGDMALWSLVMAALLELIAALFWRWRQVDLNPPRLMGQWGELGGDLKKFALFMLLGLTILYYYLVTLFMVDTFFYSYSAMILFGIFDSALYGAWYLKVIRWVQGEIAQIDSVAIDFFKTDEMAVRDILPWYQYLVLTRNYLEKLKKPQLITESLVWCLAGALWLFVLPFLIGCAVPV